MNKLTALFASVLNIEASKVSSETSQDNTPSWDSLNAIVLITEIEKAYDIKFDYDEAMAIKTFADVVSILKSKGLADFS